MDWTMSRRALLAGAAAAPFLAGVATAAANGVRRPRLLTSWYPEQWLRSDWASDLAALRDGGISMVRMAEFSWSTLEPEEGRFDFAWLDAAIDAAHAHGMAVILGTPTASPPAWLTRLRPEVRRTDQHGRRINHGARRQFCFTSPAYLAAGRRIAEAMAQRYGRDSRVVGWQIDNEIGLADYGPDTLAAFRDWLRKRYGTLAALNAAWNTAYWSLTYFDWSEITIPIPSDEGSAAGILLAWQRFLSDAWAAYLRNQIDVMRPHIKAAQPITTNYTGRWADFDLGVVAEPLDVVSWDWYYPTPHVDPPTGALLHDLNRGFKRKPVWLLESSADFGSWSSVNSPAATGETRAMAWQAVAQGADIYGFWSSRPALGGQEQMHGTLLVADGSPAPVMDEVRVIGREFAATDAAGPVAQAQIALIHDYDSRWALADQRHHKDFDPWQVHVDWHGAFAARASAMDVVSPRDALAGYRLVVAPALAILPDAVARRLEAHVRGGGWLVLGARSGTKNGEGQLWPLHAPGPLAALAGVEVAQAYALEQPIRGAGDIGTVQATIWGEQLVTTAPDTSVLARWSAPGLRLDGAPAITARRIGRGGVAYVGGLFDSASLARIAGWIAEAAGLPVPWALPVGVQHRRRDGRDVLINWSRQAVDVTLPGAADEVLTGARGVRAVTLEPYGVAVLRGLR